MKLKYRNNLIGLSLNLLILLNLNACRPPSGPDDYASQEYIPDAAMPLTLELAEGEERLSIGIFYEGPFTEEVLVDDVSSHFYIYEETFSMISFDSDRVEGLNSDLITHRGGAWWGEESIGTKLVILALGRAYTSA